MKTVILNFFKYPLQLAFVLAVTLIAQICGLLEKGIALFFRKVRTLRANNHIDKAGPACEPPVAQDITPARFRQASRLQREGEISDHQQS